jgi:hypothetical protein
MIEVSLALIIAVLILMTLGLLVGTFVWLMISGIRWICEGRENGWPLFILGLCLLLLVILAILIFVGQIVIVP